MNTTQIKITNKDLEAHKVLLFDNINHTVVDGMRIKESLESPLIKLEVGGKHKHADDPEFKDHLTRLMFLPVQDPLYLHSFKFKTNKRKILTHGLTKIIHNHFNGAVDELKLTILKPAAKEKKSNVLIGKNMGSVYSGEYFFEQQVGPKIIPYSPIFTHGHHIRVDIPPRCWVEITIFIHKKQSITNFEFPVIPNVEIPG